LEHIENELISFVKTSIFDTIESASVAERFISMFTSDVQRVQEIYFGILFANPNNSGFAKRLKMYYTK